MKLQLASLLLLLSVALPAVAEEPKPDADPAAILKLIEAAGKPGEEHQKLEPLAGKWTYTSKFWMDPEQPPMELKGTIERKWILGGRFLEESVLGIGPDGKSDFEGRGTIGFDKNDSKYTYNWICSMGTCSSNGIGEVDKSGNEFVFESEVFCPLRQKKVLSRDEIHIESSDKHVLEAYQTVDGKKVKVMELTATRAE